MRTGVTKCNWLPEQRPGLGSFPPPADTPGPVRPEQRRWTIPAGLAGDITPEDSRSLVLAFTKPLSVCLWVSGEGFLGREDQPDQRRQKSSGK